MKVVRLLLWQLAICLQVGARTPLPPPAPFDKYLDNGNRGFYPTRKYVSAKDLNFQSPQVNFAQWDPQCDDGLLTFITPRGHSIPEPGPLILDARGELIWGHHFDNSFGGQAYNLMVQKYKGEDHLTFWLGDDSVRGHGSGFYYMLNSSYDIVQKFGGANGLNADLHEFTITPEGTALVTLYETVSGDVSGFRTFDVQENPYDKDPNYIWDCIFQEIDIDTGDLLFEWRASEHVNLTETYLDIQDMGNKDKPFDYYHINSIQKDELGNYLISARYPHSIMYVDGRTTQTIWQLGGKRNSFMDLSGGNATNFAWQHDARFHPTNTFPSVYTPPPERRGFETMLLTVFDNAAEDQRYVYGQPLSRALLLEISYPTPGTEKAGGNLPEIRNGDTDDAAHDDELSPDALKMMSINGTDPNYTVRVVKSYDHPERIRSSSQGNVQVLPRGPGEDPTVFVGYGLNAVYTEFNSDGSVLCDAHYGARSSWERGDAQSYRIYKFKWTGRPRWAPSVGISDDGVMVYVSWLGATDVGEWNLQYSKSRSLEEGDWADLIRVPKISFETTIIIPKEIGETRYLRVMALAEDGSKLDYGTSKIIDRGIIASYYPSISEKLPYKVSRLSSTRLLFLIFVCVTCGLFIVYELYRRYLSWRLGRPGAGPLRWRNSPAYRLLVEA